MAKDKRSHDQKRKAKLAQRNRREAATTDVTPYEGRKYQAPRWAIARSQTEMAVYEAIIWTGHRLTNKHAGAAFTQLVRELRQGLSPVPLEAEPPLVYTPGQEAEFLIGNIRRNWGLLFQEHGKVAV